MTKFMMLVLSATGAAVPLVKRFLVDMTVPCVAWRADGVEYFLAGPGRGADQVAEILWPDGGLLAGDHTAFDVGKGGREPALAGMSRTCANVRLALRW